MTAKNDPWFGKTLVINQNVKYIHDDPDLEQFEKCCEHVCKMFVEIQKDKNDSARAD